MLRQFTLITVAIIFSTQLSAQKNSKQAGRTYPDSIAPVSVIKGLSDEQLLETVQ